ncbi:MAG: hypothetical protein CR991_10270 [Proteobacteria bacterium]|nr:MAG: hypothetical protein CR991_10270 [Pseudomonadota bacterium]
MTDPCTELERHRQREQLWHEYLTHTGRYAPDTVRWRWGLRRQLLVALVIVIIGVEVVQWLMS